MAINISGVGVQPSPTQKNERIQKDDANSTQATNNTSVNSKELMSEDTVQLSNVAQSLQAKGSNSEEAAIDMDKVEQIKLAIASGDYKIDSEKLASSMLQMDELFS
ncbi:flagellar biosynthesis anti-sigma factor FlgM [Marinomonas ostreistagni]|uniref:flagellar biosynthesis anti-sigma factor FlgM n=1 Tax=Marinomonas ostreistagni TaxID=359209 RepID=UPI0019502570|nr:flagellar biosynthesis anti-sigma factor FlgM [Marinomonas ostreistagni]MBM6551126.1 flagellar biosynthesis anti-sigma factor FlgM [Marinomonas ostreistagni]